MAAKRMSFSYPEKLQVQLSKIADEENRTVSSLIQIFIKEGLERKLRDKPSEVKTKIKKRIFRPEK